MRRNPGIFSACRIGMAAPSTIGRTIEHGNPVIVKNPQRRRRRHILDVVLGVVFDDDDDDDSRVGFGILVVLSVVSVISILIASYFSFNP